MTLGVVSNVWGTLLSGSSLAGQCRRALEAGYGYVELRQRALGECEEAVIAGEAPWPIPAALARLRATYPDLGMNLALELPFMTEPVDARSRYIEQCIAAALALGGDPPLLRFVDLSPAPALPNDEQVVVLGESVGALADRLWEQGVGLAVENSKQPVERLLAVIAASGSRQSPDVPAPQVCWDPHNQIAQQLAPEDPVATARELPVEQLFEYHFKQQRDGVLQGDVGEGDIDWRAIITTLRSRGFTGPTLFEIPAGDDAWSRLQRSTAYIQSVSGE